MKIIPLTQGYYAMVDDIDYDYLSQWKWHVHKGKRRLVAQRNKPRMFGKQHALLMHTDIMRRKDPHGEGLCIIHVDGNSLNNCRDNLMWMIEHKKGHMR